MRSRTRRSSSRAGRLLAFIRRLLRPILKLFFNPNPLIEALHIQSKLNDCVSHSEALYYELIHNLVLETTRLGIEVKNLKMRVESMSSRLDFDERRARALEGVVQYRPGAVPPLQPPADSAAGGQRAGASDGRRGGTARAAPPSPRPPPPRIRARSTGVRPGSGRGRGGQDGAERPAAEAADAGGQL